uniref:CCHC-type domain-containing protein n=1 Tax=Aegilops tauschii subsp. strangulata TaxID=200361 RepID=A0A453LMN2_AEGTS
MGENQGLQQVLEKLAQLLTEKTGGGSPSGREMIPYAETVHKIELMPNDIKLEGVRNYLSWSRRALLILKTKGLESFVEGESTKPVGKASAEWRNWNTTNSLLVAWMLNSLSLSIAATVETISNAAEVWKTLSKLYSGKGNVMLMVETQERVSDLRQGEHTVMEYVAELQRLWADLDHFDPLELPHADCISTVKKWIERRRVIQFLKDLNSEFEGRRATMFHQPTLPTLEEAIAAIAQEEVRLKVMKNNITTPSRPAFIVRNSETRECFNCGETGHLSRDCHAPRGPTRGRGRGNGRGGTRGGRGRGYRIDHKANVAVHEDESSDKVEFSVKELEELRKLKRKMENAGNKGQGDITFGDFAHFAYANEGEANREEAWDCKQA